MIEIEGLDRALRNLSNIRSVLSSMTMKRVDRQYGWKAGNSTVVVTVLFIRNEIRAYPAVTNADVEGDAMPMGVLNDAT